VEEAMFHTAHTSHHQVSLEPRTCTHTHTHPWYTDVWMVIHLSTSPITTSHSAIRDISIPQSKIYCTHYGTVSARMAARLLTLRAHLHQTVSLDRDRSQNATKAAFRHLVKTFLFTR